MSNDLIRERSLGADFVKAAAQICHERGDTFYAAVVAVVYRSKDENVCLGDFIMVERTLSAHVRMAALLIVREALRNELKDFDQMLGDRQPPEAIKSQALRRDIDGVGPKNATPG